MGVASNICFPSTGSPALADGKYLKLRGTSTSHRVTILGLHVGCGELPPRKRMPRHCVQASTFSHSMCRRMGIHRCSSKRPAAKKDSHSRHGSSNLRMSKLLAPCEMCLATHAAPGFMMRADHGFCLVNSRWGLTPSMSAIQSTLDLP